MQSNRFSNQVTDVAMENMFDVEAACDNLLIDQHSEHISIMIK